MSEEPSREELLRHVAELNREIIGLRAKRDEDEWVELCLRERTRLLNERVKELSCVYEAVKLLRDARPLDDKLRRLAEALPSALQHSRYVCARVALGGRVFETNGFRETPWGLSEEVRVGGLAVGSLAVHYLKALPEAEHGPFLREEKALLAVLAELAGVLATSPARS